jgi:CHAT domain-containing protein
VQRAYKIAGVENLLMTLWKIPDLTASEFMKEFYKRIFDKQSVQMAFYGAQTTMKNRYCK